MTVATGISRRSLLFGCPSAEAGQDCVRPLEAVVETAVTRRFAHVVAIADSCLARNAIACQSCRDNCPELAIRFRPRMGGPFLPEVDGDLCSGCGACIGVCPAGAIHTKEREGADA